MSCQRMLVPDLCPVLQTPIYVHLHCQITLRLVPYDPASHLHLIASRLETQNGYRLCRNEVDKPNEECAEKPEFGWST